MVLALEHHIARELPEVFGEELVALSPVNEPTSAALAMPSLNDKTEIVPVIGAAPLA